MARKQEKKRIIVVNDALVPRLVRILEEEQAIDNEAYQLAIETGTSYAVSKKNLIETQALLEAVGRPQCLYCDDNQGRTDGRGCRSCNELSRIIDEIGAGPTGPVSEHPGEIG